MIEYTEKNSKRWAVLGERPAFGLAVLELAKDDSSIIAVVADTTNSSGLERLKNTLPDQLVNVGIAEQNMMGIATGLASEGFKVVTNTFAPFQAIRCLEQIRVNQGYMKQKVVMAGLASGVAYGELGHTHCCLEDVSILRSIPNIAVLVPADCTEVVKCVEAAVAYNQSVYIRLMDKTNVPVVYNGDYEFEIGKAVRLREDGDIAVIANGPMVSRAIEAANALKEEGINISVYDMHTVKPVDSELVKELCKTKKAIITVEEHSVIGGLGSAVLESMASDMNRIPLFMMGVPDEFCHGASHDTILSGYHLDRDGIIDKVKCVMEDIKK